MAKDALSGMGLTLRERHDFADTIAGVLTEIMDRGDMGEPSPGGNSGAAQNCESVRLSTGPVNGHAGGRAATPIGDLQPQAVPLTREA